MAHVHQQIRDVIVAAMEAGGLPTGTSVVRQQHTVERGAAGAATHTTVVNLGPSDMLYSDRYDVQSRELEFECATYCEGYATLVLVENQMLLRQVQIVEGVIGHAPLRALVKDLYWQSSEHEFLESATTMAGVMRTTFRCRYTVDQRSLEGVL